jgi:hypothetical protein
VPAVVGKVALLVVFCPSSSFDAIVVSELTEVPV